MGAAIAGLLLLMLVNFTATYCKPWQVECRGAGGWHVSPPSAYLSLLASGKCWELETDAYYPHSHLPAGCIGGMLCIKEEVSSHITATIAGHGRRGDKVAHALCPIRNRINKKKSWFLIKQLVQGTSMALFAKHAGLYLKASMLCKLSGID